VTGAVRNRAGVQTPASSVELHIAGPDGEPGLLAHQDLGAMTRWDEYAAVHLPFTAPAPGTYRLQVCVAPQSTEVALDNNCLEVDVEVVAPATALAVAAGSYWPVATETERPWTAGALPDFAGLAVAAHSGALGAGETSAMWQDLEGPGILAYRTRVETSSGTDVLQVLVDGVQVAEISDSDWGLRELELGPGTHRVAWVHVRSADTAGPDDCAWVFDVHFRRAPPRDNPRALVVPVDGRPVGGELTGGGEVVFRLHTAPGRRYYLGLHPGGVSRPQLDVFRAGQQIAAIPYTLLAYHILVWPDEAPSIDWVLVTARDGWSGPFAVTAEEYYDQAGGFFQLASAVLPSSRSIGLGQVATVFASVVSTGPGAESCTIAPSSPLPLEFSFQRTDPATNLPIGLVNEPVAIAATSAQA
jgi:hypothetical protein